jgi:hypothetical protein
MQSKNAAPYAMYTHAHNKHSKPDILAYTDQRSYDTWWYALVRQQPPSLCLYKDCCCLNSCTTPMLLLLVATVDLQKRLLLLSHFSQQYYTQKRTHRNIVLQLYTCTQAHTSFNNLVCLMLPACPLTQRKRVGASTLVASLMLTAVILCSCDLLL